jgi:hypothetical protein
LTERGGRRPGQADYTGASRRSQAGGVAMSAHPSARTSHRPLATHRVARGRFVFPVERTLRSVETHVRPDGDQRTQHATGWSNRTNPLESDEHGNVPFYGRLSAAGPDALAGRRGRSLLPHASSRAVEFPAKPVGCPTDSREGVRGRMPGLTTLLPLAY